MSGFERRYGDLRCDHCGKESTLFAPDVKTARAKLNKSGWRTYMSSNKIFDACRSCPPPQGKEWKRRS